MAKVRGYTEDDVDVLVDRFDAVVQESMARAVGRAADDVAMVVTAAGVLVGAGPTPGITPESAGQFNQYWSEEVDGTLTPYLGEVYTGSAAQVALGIGTAFPDDAAPGILVLGDASDYTVDYLQHVTNQLEGVGAEVWENVRNELLDGVTQGQSIPQISARIRSVSGFSQSTSTRVARTQVHAAAEAGSIAQMRFLTYPDEEVTKEWLATHDLRTRETHRRADGQQVPMNEKFTVGGWPMDHPGDYTAPAAEKENCRCTTLFNAGPPPAESRCVGLVAAGPPSGAGCVTPVPKVDTSHLSTIKMTVFNEFMKHGLVPSSSGPKILAAVDDLIANTSVPMTREEVISIIDEYYVPKGKLTFGEKFHGWAQSPAGQKALGGHTLPKAVGVKVPAVSPTLPPPSTPVPTPTILSEPKGTFRILEDSGPSGDGSIVPGGPWGKYGASGVLVEATDDQGVTRYLLVQRGAKYKGTQQGRWQLPGGGMDGLENPYQGAAREMFEETGAPKAYIESMTPVGETSVDGPAGWRYTTIAARTKKTFVPKIDPAGTTGDARWFTIDELEQLVKNGDVVDELAPTLMPITRELAAVPDTATFDLPGALPPIAPKPNPADLTFTGKTLGSHGAQVWTDKAGQRWLFKPQEDWATDLDIGLAKLQSKGLLTRPAIYRFTLQGKKGSLQFMFDSTEAFPGGSFDVATLSPADLLILQREQIFDWLVSNFDTHSGQFIRLSDGTLYGTDKGQAFKFFGKDKLDWGYVPVTPLGQDKLTYSQIWKAFVSGKPVGLMDPTTGELGAFIERMQAIPDHVFRTLLRPYADFRESIGLGKASDFLDAVVARKQALRTDFEDFWVRAQEARAKALGLPAPAPPVPATATPIVSGPGLPPGVPKGWKLGDTVSPAEIDKAKQHYPDGQVIAHISSNTHSGEYRLVATGGDGTVSIQVRTGGNWSTLKIVKPGNKVATQVAGTSSRNQWILGDFPAAPTTTVVTAPVADPAAAAFATGVQMDTFDLWASKGAYSEGEVIGYAKTSNGSVLRATRAAGGDVKVEVRSLTDPSQWNPAGTYATSGAVNGDMNTYGYAAYGEHIKWSKVVPTAAKNAASKVPGLVPGDAVTFQQLDASKMLWNDGDLMAQGVLPTSGPLASTPYRMISDGKGGWTVEGKSPVGWFKVSPSTEKQIIWKLGPDALAQTGKAASAIPGYGVGDVLAPNALIQSGVSTQVSGPLAYAYDTATGTESRVVTGLGWPRLEYRTAGSGGKWIDAGQVPSATDPAMANQVWRVAKLNGDAPDAHIAAIQSAVSGSKYAGKAVGDSLTVADIQTTAHQFDHFEVVAYGKQSITGHEYRLYWTDDQHLVVEEKVPGGAWQYGGVYTDKSSISAGTSIKWEAPAPGTKVAKASVNVKDSIKQAKNLAVGSWTKSAPPPGQAVKKSGAKFGGKKPGASITVAEIQSDATMVPDLEIIAQGIDPQTGFEYRLYWVTPEHMGMEFRGPKAGGGWTTWEYNLIMPDPASLDGYAGVDWKIPAKVGGKAPKASKAGKGYKALKVDADSMGTGQTSWTKVVVSPQPVAVVKTNTITGVTAPGTKVSASQIVADVGAFDDGVVMAYGQSSYGGYEYRAVSVDGHVVIQKKNAKGAWVGSKATTSSNSSAFAYNLQWKSAGGETLSKAQLTAAKKVVAAKKAKTLAPKPSSYSGTYKSKSGPYYPSAPSNPYTPIAGVDISAWDANEQAQIAAAFQKEHGTYGQSKEHVWNVLQAVKQQFQAKGGKHLQLNEIEILRIVDEQHALTAGTPDTHAFEAKVVEWMKTPEGKAYINKRIDAPLATTEIPAPMEDFASSTVPADQQVYSDISSSAALAARQDSHARYGAWTGPQKSAAKAYTGGSYGSWNAAIRTGNLGKYKAQIRAEQAAMRPSTVPMLLRRKTTFDELNDPRIRDYQSLLPHVGEIYTNRGFMSTSVGSSPTWSGNLTIEVEAPVGTPMAYVADISHFTHEKETTLATHLIFKILSVRKSGYDTIMRVRVIGVAQP